jgi:3-oxoacyl-[acyl-carrier protein] reductase
VVIVARGAEALARTAGELRAQGRVGGAGAGRGGRHHHRPRAVRPSSRGRRTGHRLRHRRHQRRAAAPGDFRDWNRDAWIKAVDANMLTPIELIKATVDGMAARGFGRIVNITSSAVKAPIDILGLSNGARSGLTGFVAGVARSGIAARGRHPQQPAARQVRHRPHGRHHAARRCRQGRQKRGRRAPRPAGADTGGALRHAEEFGAICAFLCSRSGLHHGAEHPGRRRRLSPARWACWAPRC